MSTETGFFTQARPANVLVTSSFPTSRHFDVLPSPDIEVCPDPIREALLRSYTSARRHVEAGTSSFETTPQEAEGNHQSSSNKMEKDECESDAYEALLGYDAQWCWVESKDDVTFL